MESAEERRQAESARFWEGRAQLTYYLVSLPFAIVAAAIASYPDPQNVPLALRSGEVLAWLSLLASGVFGVVAKRAEVEQHRLATMQASAKAEREERSCSGSAGAFSEGQSRVLMDRERRLLDAESAETKASEWHVRLLVLGVGLWVLTRSIMVLFR